MSDASHHDAAARLRARTQDVIDRWQHRVRQQLEAARRNDVLALIDSMPEVLDRLATLLESRSPARELAAESSLAIDHGRQRAGLPAYSLEQVIVEYQLLRDVLLEVLDEGGPVDHLVRDRIAAAILVAVRDSATEFARLRASATASELREVDARFRHMVDAVKDYALFTVSPDGVITSWNTGCVRMKRYTADEAIGQHFSMLYPEEGRRRDEPMQHLRSAAIEGRFRGEGVRVRKTGELFLADVSISPMYEESRVIGYSKVVQDLTERNALIQERDLSRIDTLRLRDEATYRERFVATLTHDLRSPLATAKISADMITLHTDRADKVPGWAAMISSALERADRMIGDLLDSTRQQAAAGAPLEVARCDLRQIVDDACRELAALHGDRFAILAEGSTVGYWHADGLRRVADNLLSNALKYGDPRWPISVRLRGIDDRVLLSVHNLGPVIPVEEQDRLFEAFHRASTAEFSGKPGWGLGLALVKEVVEAHGGIVKAESYPKEGTTFTIDLPVDARRSGA